jgi:polyisoprenoid-binding protein YceI
MNRYLTAASIAAFVMAPAFAEQTLEGVDTATYELDRNHAFLTWTVIHNGISSYTGHFTDFDATLDFNSENPASSTLKVTINPMAVETNYPADYQASQPDSEYDTWNETLARGDKFLQAGEYDEITFTSTDAQSTSDFSGTVTGDLSFRSQTRPVTLDVTYNGVANLPWYGERDLVGFDATTTISRSEFGLDALQGVVSDDVTIEFSGEFLQAE